MNMGLMAEEADKAISPRQYIKHLEELVKQNPMIKPAEALGKLKAALGLPAHLFEHDKTTT